MLINNFKKRHLAELAHVGSASKEVKRLLKDIEEGRKINRKRYPQISQEAFDFITKDLPKLPKNEQEINLSFLLLTPSPR